MKVVSKKDKPQSLGKHFRNFTRNLQRVQVYALIGKSGTGKSFRAYLLLERYGIDILIDDGLLIQEQRILTGKTAKNENSHLAAVKRALFLDDEHQQSALQTLAGQRARRILVLGTSRKMIENICQRLNLPSPKKIILIENIASKKEIEQAQNKRQGGKHTIPVPTVEVQKDHPKLGEKALRIIFQKDRGWLKTKKRKYEKSIVHPSYGPQGIISISESALSQMLMHCIEEFDQLIEIIRIIIKQQDNDYGIDIHVGLPYQYEVAKNVPALQEYIIHHIETYSHISLLNVNVIVSNVRK